MDNIALFFIVVAIGYLSGGYVAYHIGYHRGMYHAAISNSITWIMKMMKSGFSKEDCDKVIGTSILADYSLLYDKYFSELKGEVEKTKED